MNMHTEGEMALDSPATSHPQALARLSVLDTPFASTGYATIRVTRQGVGRDVQLPIKSVDLDAVLKIVEPLRPKIPRRREQVGRQWVTVLDEADDTYQQKLSEYNSILGHVWILLALDVDVCDGQGDVVWSADNTVCKRDQAVEALKQMGLTTNQFIDIQRQVRQLTESDEADYAQD